MAKTVAAFVADSETGMEVWTGVLTVVLTGTESVLMVVVKTGIKIGLMAEIQAGLWIVELSVAKTGEWTEVWVVLLNEQMAVAAVVVLEVVTMMMEPIPYAALMAGAV